MKNKIKKLLAVLLCAAMCIPAFVMLTACGETETLSYPVVYSNGGTTVQYGNYVYYINGVPDYTDENGKTNRQGSVIKGGLYRTEITNYRGNVHDEELKEGNVGADGKTDNNISDNGALRDMMDFKYEKRDYLKLHDYQIGDPDNGEDAQIAGADGKMQQNVIATNGEKSEYAVTSEQVISKKIGTSGYADGGFWIYDDIVYFASPDTDQNSEGEVQYNRAEFYSYNLNNKSLSQVYTAKEVNVSTPYTFYKHGDNVYLLTFETYFANAEDEADGIQTGFIVSTTISNGVATETKEIASGVGSVHFPKKETYNAADNVTNTIADFVYFTRNATSDDNVSGGTILEMIRPDGSYREEIVQITSGSLSIAGVAGSYIYYNKPTASGTTILECSNLYAQLKKFDKDADVTYNPTAETTVISDTSAYTKIVPIATEQDNIPCVLAVASDGFYRVDTVNGRTKVYNGQGTFVGYHNGRAYGYLSSESESSGTTMSTLFSCSAFEQYTAQTLKLISGYAPNVTNFNVDFFSVKYKTEFIGNKDYETTETYISFFSTYYEGAADYMYLRKIDGIYNYDGTMAIKLGVVPEYENKKIVCYDTDCIDWHHDHTSWEDFGGDEEEGEGNEPSDSTFTG